MKRLAFGVAVVAALIAGAPNASADGICDKAPGACETIERLPQHVPLADDEVCVTVWVGDDQHEVCLPLYS